MHIVESVEHKHNLFKIRKNKFFGASKLVDDVNGYNYVSYHH